MKIVYVPHFELTLTLELVKAFMKMSETHYDAVCQKASVGYNPIRLTHGFVHGWHNAVTNFANENGKYVDRVDMHRLDTLMKICENTLILDHNAVALVNRFVIRCHTAVSLVRKVTPLEISVS